VIPASSAFQAAADGRVVRLALFLSPSRDPSAEEKPGAQGEAEAEAKSLRTPGPNINPSLYFLGSGISLPF